MTLADLAGTSWHGTSELWLDPLGNDAQTSPCTLQIDAGAVHYTWEYQGTPHRGSVTPNAEGASFTDTWHSPTPITCPPVPGSHALLDVIGTYAAGDGPPWGWRVIVSHRPPFGSAPEALVLQMTNIAPWGEEARAVRMVGQRR